MKNLFLGLALSVVSVASFAGRGSDGENGNFWQVGMDYHSPVVTMYDLYGKAKEVSLSPMDAHGVYKFNTEGKILDEVKICDGYERFEGIRRKYRNAFMTNGPLFKGGRSYKRVMVVEGKVFKGSYSSCFSPELTVGVEEFSQSVNNQFDMIVDRFELLESQLSPVFSNKSYFAVINEKQSLKDSLNKMATQFLEDVGDTRTSYLRGRLRSSGRGQLKIIKDVYISLSEFSNLPGVDIYTDYSSLENFDTNYFVILFNDLDSAYRNYYSETNETLEELKNSASRFLKGSSQWFKAQRQIQDLWSAGEYNKLIKLISLGYSIREKLSETKTYYRLR